MTRLMAAADRLTASVARLESAAALRLGAVDALCAQHRADLSVRDARLAEAQTQGAALDAERTALLAVTGDLGDRLDAALVRVKAVLEG